MVKDGWIWTTFVLEFFGQTFGNLFPRKKLIPKERATPLLPREEVNLVSFFYF
jgi:hypothetical protein